MKLKTLILDRFGPFEYYELSFPTEDDICVLLTGRNNEGKSTIINALRILHAATRVVNRDTTSLSQPLKKQDTEYLEIGRLIHNYEGGMAEITGVFANDAQITVHLDADTNSVYCYHSRNVPKDISQIFGFIPPLGQLAEEEFLISNVWHLRKSLNTTLAPHHLRNHLSQFLTAEQFKLIRTIVNDTWEGIELLECEHDVTSNRLHCLYRENGIEREISWAGQGLQVWPQIITHLVRLMNTSILILDEPEIFLHIQKQNDLVRTLREYYSGSIIIATHSVELMNNVDVSHIIHVKKAQTKPKIKSTKDRGFLEQVRSHVGSNFNLIASQFEDVDILIFTEDRDDFNIISRLAEAYGIKKRAFDIPIHGFPEYAKCTWFKEAYEKFFGKQIEYSVVLDRDYYPKEYLDQVASNLAANGLKAIFTPGKEIENIFLNDKLLFELAPLGHAQDLKEFMQQLFELQYDDCLGSFLSLHEKFLPGKKKDAKTVLKDYKPGFDSAWNDPQQKFAEIGGKMALGRVRKFFAEKFNIHLSTKFLIDKLTQLPRKSDLNKFIAGIYQT